MYNLSMKIVKILLIVFLAILLPAGAYFGYKTLKKTEPAENGANPPAVTEKQNEESLFSGKITDLLSLGKSLKCTYTMNEQEGTIGTGNIYVSGTKMRGDSTITMENNTSIDSHFISTDNVMYTWTSASPQGYKIALDQEAIDNAAAGTPSGITEEAKALQEKLDYKCLPWIPDQSLFELPAGVEFVDMSEITKPTGGDGDTGNMCAICGMMQTEEEKTECLSNFNCE